MKNIDGGGRGGNRIRLRRELCNLPPPPPPGLWSVKLLHNPARPDYRLPAKLDIFQFHEPVFPLGAKVFVVSNCRSLLLRWYFYSSGYCAFGSRPYSHFFKLLLCFFLFLKLIFLQ
jgi:hypothetical protein